MFGQDHIARDDKGVPIGRIVLVDDSEYIVGMDRIRVAVLKVPIEFKLHVPGLELYIDGNRYKVPESLPAMRINRREKDIVAASFVLERHTSD